MNDENLKPVEKLTPFTKMIMTIGTLPSSFYASMSYYESMVWLYEYLKNEVIPAVNNNGEAVSELQEKFIELKTWVIDYETTQLPIEVINKLDEMATDGTLQAMLDEIMKYKGLQAFDTIENLKESTNLVEGSFAETYGFNSLGDNGGSKYKIRKLEESDTIDEMTLLSLADESLVAELIINETIRPEQLGAYGDGIHDDSTPIQKAIDIGKVVDFSEKTYMCFDLSVTSPVTLNGNNCILKRPNLSIDPYNYTVEQMRGVKTITASADIKIDKINFDNNCFTMWSLEDGYAQSQSASIYLNNSTNIFYAYISNCSFRNSAGDGIMVFNRCKLFIKDCESTETFRGGLTMVGTSEINVDGWISNSITLPDGFDLEMATGYSEGTFILNMNNVIMDYDLDLAVPTNGICNVSNLIMREFNQNEKVGFIFTVRGALNITNSILRSGVYSNYSVYYGNNGTVNIDNCKIIGNTTSEIFNITYASGLTNADFNLTNSIVKGYDFIKLGLFNGNININNCNIDNSNSFLVQSGNTGPQPRYMNVSNCKIKNGGTDFIYITKSQYATYAEGVNLFLSNINLFGTGKMHFGGAPKIHYNNLTMEALYDNIYNQGSVPIFIGKDRFIVVAEASELTFKGWKENNDIALALDDGKYYKYTTGTTWTEIV